MKDRNFTAAYERGAGQQDFSDDTFGSLDELLPMVKEALAVQSDGTIRIGNYTLTATGLQGGSAATLEEWEQLGDVLRRLDGALQWLIGDWLLQGERVYGKTYDQIAAATGYKKETLYEWKRVAERVQFPIRMGILTFAHHQLVAGMAQLEQSHWLELAADNGWSISQMRKAIKGDPPALPPEFAPSIGTKAHGRLLIATIIQAGRGNKTALQELRQRIWELAQWADELERGEP